MEKTKPWKFKSFLSLFLLMALGTSGIGLLSHFLQSDRFRLRVQAWVQQQTGWEISSQRIHLGFWPLPHAEIRGVAIHIPETGTITAASLEIYPRLGGWMSEQGLIERLRIVAPVIRITLPVPEKAPTPKVSAPASTPAAIEALVEQRILPLVRRFTGVYQNGLIQIEKGELRIESEGRRMVDLSRLNLALQVLRRGVHVNLSTWAAGFKQEVSFSGRIHYGPDRISFQALAGHFGPSDFSGLSGHARWKQDPGIWISSGTFNLGVKTFMPLLTQASTGQELLRDISSLSLKFQIASASAKGPLLEPSRWQIQAAGQMDDLSFETLQLPGLTRVRAGAFTFRQGELRLSQVQISARDSKLVVAATAQLSPAGDLTGGDLYLNGKLGPKSLQRLGKEFGIPPALLPRAPLQITSSRVQWKKRGPLKVQLDLAWPDQLMFSAVGSFSSQGLSLDRLTLKDPLERIDLSLRATPKALDLTFSGRSTTELFNRVFNAPLVADTLLQGDLKLHIPRQDLTQVRAEGHFNAKDLTLPIFPGTPVQIGEMILSGKGRSLGVELEKVQWGETKVSTQGRIFGTSEGIHGALTVSAQSVDVDALLRAVNALSAGTTPTASASSYGLPWQLDLEVQAERARLLGRGFTAVQADLQLTTEVVALQLAQADLSGIKVSGTIRVQDQIISVDLVPEATQQDLARTLRAQVGESFRMTGSYDLRGRITGQGTSETLIDRLQGTLYVRAYDGRIFEWTFLTHLLSLIQLTEVVVGTVPDWSKEGLGYKQCKVQAQVQQGRLVVEEGILNADNMDVTAQGSLKLTDSRLAGTILVAPFKTLNRVVGGIPVVKYIFNDHLIAFPFELSGTLEQPKVSSATPASADEGAYGIMKRTVMLPFEVFVPGQTKGQKTGKAGSEAQPVSRTAKPDLTGPTPQAIEPRSPALEPDETQPTGAPTPITE